MSLEVSAISQEFNVLTPAQWDLNRPELKVHLTNQSVLDAITSLNYVSTDQLVDQQLVRFVGMIQDMYDPEYYLDRYEIENTVAGSRSLKSGRYRDIHPCGNDEQFIEDSSENVTLERQSYYCISIPGLNDWVIQKECKKVVEPARNIASPSCGEKRTLETEDVDMETTNDNKRVCTQTKKGNTNKPQIDLNFPIANPNGKACILKVYEECSDIKWSLNECIEAVGFISLDPLIASISDDPDFDMEAKHLPASLVPRLHCISVRRYQPDLMGAATSGSDLSGAAASGSDLRLLLTQLLFGDHLAAEYLVCHLLSTVYLRRDVMALGQFSVNIHNFPPAKEYNPRFYNIISMLVEKSHYLPLSLDHVNTSTFLPKKNYSTNRLATGMLQLSSRTHLVVDETMLQEGTLNATGLGNVNALKAMMVSQRLSYDFQYYPIEFDTDVPVLVLSEGKSLLPCDCYLSLDADPTCVDTINEIFQATGHFLQESMLQQIRCFLRTMSRQEFHMPPDIEQLVTEEFVKLRQEDPSMSPSDLHALIVLARLVTLSYGDSTLSVKHWQKAVMMERQRKARISSRQL